MFIGGLSEVYQAQGHGFMLSHMMKLFIVHDDLARAIEALEQKKHDEAVYSSGSAKVCLLEVFGVYQWTGAVFCSVCIEGRCWIRILAGRHGRFGDFAHQFTCCYVMALI